MTTMIDTALAAEMFPANVYPTVIATRTGFMIACNLTVDTSELDAVRYTMSRIVSDCLYAGATCTPPQALAAAFSVPDGAPIAMAIANVGPLPSDEVVAKFESYRAVERANVRAIKRAIYR